MSRDRGIRTIALDVVLALAGGAAALNEVHTSAIGLLPAAAGPPVAVLAGIALLVRRRWTIPVLMATALAEILVGAALPMVLAMYTVANRYGNRLATWLCGAGALVAAAVPWGPPWSTVSLIDRAPFAVLYIAFPLLLGLWANQRRELVDGLRERAEQAERERDLRATAAVEAERIRIAGELHDIVAHRISQITVQAGALEVSTDGRPAEIAATIRKTGAQALNEMREMLGVLRQERAEEPSEKASLRPAPDLTAIAELIDESITAGQRVEASIPAELPEVSGPVGRAAYRLVQESLTNAAKHAAGAVVRVSLTVRDRGLEVDVRNGPGDRSAAALHGSGFGLLGMRERVELAGGTLHSAALPTGGFRVHARFPLAKTTER